MAPILTRVGQAFGFGASSGGASGPTGVSATGGTKTTVGDYTLHTFTSPGNFVTSADTNGNIQFLMVGGGGSGGNDSAGGGGAGALLVGADVPVGPSQTMAIAIGDGGNGQPGYCNPDTPANSWNFTAPKAGGSDTTFAHPGGTVTAYGGSAGGVSRSTPGGYGLGPMSPGNSPDCFGGGGGAAKANPEGSGVRDADPPKGNDPTSPYYAAYPLPGSVGPLITKHIYKGGPANPNAGAPTNSQWCGGGGAGAGGNGNANTPTGGGVGGAGFHAAPLAWFPPTGGVSGYIAGGGGAGGPDGSGDTAGAGGSGGGGAGGGGNPGAGTAGTANTGSGGGGSDQLAAADGGSGVCYIAYPT